MQNYAVKAQGLRDCEKTCSYDISGKPTTTLPTYQDYTIGARANGLDDLGFITVYNSNRPNNILSKCSEFMGIDRELVPVKHGVRVKFYLGDKSNEDEIVKDLSSSLFDYVIGYTYTLKGSPKAYLEAIRDDIETFKDAYDVYAGLLELDDRYLEYSDLLMEIFERLNVLNKSILVNANMPINPDILKIYKGTVNTHGDASEYLNEKLEEIKEVSGFSYVPSDIIEAEEREYRQIQSGTVVVGNYADTTKKSTKGLKETIDFLNEQGIVPVGYSKRKVILPRLTVNEELTKY